MRPPFRRVLLPALFGAALVAALAFCERPARAPPLAPAAAPAPDA